MAISGAERRKRRSRDLYESLVERSHSEAPTLADDIRRDIPRLVESENQVNTIVHIYFSRQNKVNVHIFANDDDRWKGVSRR